MDKRVFKVILGIIIFSLLIILGNIYLPKATAVFLDILWFLLLSVVAIFLGLGLLTIIGLKKEVSRVLDLILEGSFTIIDILNLIKMLWDLFIRKLKAFLLYAAPFFSYLLAFALYTLLLFVYKLIGKFYDVTALTVILTIFSVVAIGLFNKPDRKKVDTTKWIGMFLEKVRFSFSDSLEVILIVFFLTLDSTNLFFIPRELNVPLKAEVFGYDLMEIGFSIEHSRATLSIIILAVFTEIIRNVLRIIALALKYNRKDIKHLVEVIDDKSINLRLAVRKSFNDSKDDLIKFIAFTTILLFATLLLPRLKLAAMAIASITSLFLDFFIPQRLTVVKGEDLISRTITKVFKV